VAFQEIENMGAEFFEENIRQILIILAKFKKYSPNLLKICLILKIPAKI
jgi:hypothetical protein